MAVAEARAVWQRTANRCFVQEDAKRAPKLACCQSSSASKQVDAGPTATADGQDHPTVGFVPLNRNPSSNLSPDSRWWLQMQPNYGYQKGFTYDQIHALENEEGTAKAGVVKSTSRISEAHKRKGDATDFDGKNNCFAGDNHGAKKKVSEVRKSNVEALGCKNIEELIELEDSWEMLQMDPIDCPDNKKPREMCFDAEYSFLGSEKNEPWWWISDKDELASLVARKSLDHVENCDLPPPQKMCHRRPPYSHVGCFDNKEDSVSSLDLKTHTSSLSSNMTARSQGFENSGKSQEKHGSDKTSSYDSIHKHMPEIQPDCESEFSKAQLMEALCHSQTRAREAEKAAKKACAEKEHIVTLFFRQASLLFAYKQWFQLLQLETLCAQFKNNDKQASTLFPVSLPWLSTNSKDRKPSASLHKGVKNINRGERKGQPSNNTTKYAVAFALGLSLVGAGLLLGWTVGWMLPHF